LETNYKYPPEYIATGNAAIQSMITAHMDAYPVETVTWLEKSPSDRRVIDATATSYKSFTGNTNKPTLFLPYKMFKFNGYNNSIGTGFVNYAGTTDETASASYYETLKYTHYDTQGSYLWAYKGRYPVAEIRNADNAQVLSALGGTTFAQMAAMTDSPTIMTKLDAVRAALTSSLVTSYIYQPLVGVSRSVAPNGLSIYYTYDALQRLEKIKDNNNQTVKSYKYNYATP
jgi:hypothetical protein